MGRGLFSARLRKGWRRRVLRDSPVRDVGIVVAAGWITRVHLQARRSSGHRLLCAMDPSDAGIAILDEYFPDSREEKRALRALGYVR